MEKSTTEIETNAKQSNKNAWDGTAVVAALHDIEHREQWLLSFELATHIFPLIFDNIEYKWNYVCIYCFVGAVFFSSLPFLFSFLSLFHLFHGLLFDAILSARAKSLRLELLWIFLKGIEREKEREIQRNSSLLFQFNSCDMNYSNFNHKCVSYVCIYFITITIAYTTAQYYM